MFCLQAIYPDADVNSLKGFDENPLLAHKVSADPDTMWMHQAIKQPDKKQFVKAMKKEWQDQLDNGNFSVTHRRNVPQGATILPAVWQMKRKRCIKTRQIKKWKARLNIDGSCQKPGLHCDETHAPVAKWNSMQTMLILSAVNN